MQSPNLSANEEWCAGGNSDPDGEGFTVESVKVNHGIIHHLHAIASLDPNIQVVLAAGAPDPPEIEAEMMQEVNKLKAAGHHQIVWIREMMPPADLIVLFRMLKSLYVPRCMSPLESSILKRWLVKQQ